MAKFFAVAFWCLVDVTKPGWTEMSRHAVLRQ
jgi:hypothetical protein